MTPPGPRVGERYLVWLADGPAVEATVYLVAANGVWLQTDDGRKLRSAWWKLSPA